MPQVAMFVPGIKGSVLKEGTNQRWPSNGFNDLLRLSLWSGAANLTAVDVVRSVKAAGYEFYQVYQPLLTAMAQAGCDVQIHPYDWRQDLFDLWERLRDQIADAYYQSGAPVTLVCHSMGSLLAKLTLLNGAAAYVDRIITLGAPWHGAPDAYRILEFGEIIGPEHALRRYAGALLAFQSPGSPELAASVARSCASVYQLLPDRWLAEQLGGYIGKKDGAGLHDFTESASAIDVNDKFEPGGFSRFASPLHDALRNPWPAGVQHFNLIGYGEATPAHVMEDPEWYVQRYDDLTYHPLTKKACVRFADGDQTVPLLSATPPDDHQAAIRYVREAHDRLACNSSVLTWVTNILQGQPDVAVEGLERAIEERGEVREKIVMISCPVEFNVDADAPRPSNDILELVQSFIQQVPPGVKVLDLGETRYLRLGANQDLALNIESFGTGPLNVGILDYLDGQVERSIQFPEVELTPQTSATLVVTAEGGSLRVRDEQRPEGHAVPAHSVEEPEHLLDKTPPTVRIVVESRLTGRVAGRFGHGPHRLRLEAHDDESGILDRIYRINGGRWHKYSAPVDITEYGHLNIEAYATDGLRNKPTKLAHKSIRLYSPETYLRPYIEYGSAVIKVRLRTPDGHPPDEDTAVEWWLDDQQVAEYDDKEPLQISYDQGDRTLHFRAMDVTQAGGAVQSVSIKTSSLRESLWGNGRPLTVGEVAALLTGRAEGEADFRVDQKTVGAFLNVHGLKKAKQLQISYPDSVYTVLLRPTYQCYSQGNEIVQEESTVQVRLGLIDQDPRVPVTYPELIARLYVKKNKKHELLRTMIPKVNGSWYEFTLKYGEDLPWGETTFRLDVYDYLKQVKSKPFVYVR